MTDNNEFQMKISETIEQTIKPALASHGGGIELVSADAESGIVKVKLQGACSGCPGAMATLKGFVEAQLVEAVSEVKGVEPVN